MVNVRWSSGVKISVDFQGKSWRFRAKSHLQRHMRWSSALNGESEHSTHNQFLYNSRLICSPTSFAALIRIKPGSCPDFRVVSIHGRVTAWVHGVPPPEWRERRDGGLRGGDKVIIQPFRSCCQLDWSNRCVIVWFDLGIGILANVPLSQNRRMERFQILNGSRVGGFMETGSRSNVPQPHWQQNIDLKKIMVSGKKSFWMNRRRLI